MKHFLLFIIFSFIPSIILSAPCEDTADDNSAFRSESRCTLASIDYYQFLPVMKFLASHLNYRPVKVAIIDSGLDINSGQFDDVDLTNIMVPQAPLQDYDTNHFHGTKVTSIIAADDGDGLINGIASIILGPNLRLIIGYNSDRNAGATIDSVRRAIQGGAQIVNLSFGFKMQGVTNAGFAQYRAAWQRFFNEPIAQRALFVVAAPNYFINVTNTSDAPAGMNFPNVITVGGFNACNPARRDMRLAHGPAIDVSAPGGDHPIILPDGSGGPPRGATDFGNSYSAAVVTSMAAIMKSLDPLTTPVELKQYLTESDFTLPTSYAISGKRVSLIKTIGTFLLRRMSGNTHVKNVFDAFPRGGDGEVDPPGIVISKVCNESKMIYQFDNPGGVNSGGAVLPNNFDYTGPPNGGGLGHDMLSISVTDGSRHMNLSTFPGTFEVGHTYQIPSQAISSMGRGPVDNLTYAGAGIIGSLVIEGCEITTRSLSLDHATNTGELKVYINLWGAVSASHLLRNLHDHSAQPEIWFGSNNFHLPVALIALSDAMEEYLETNCYGGYRYR